LFNNNLIIIKIYCQIVAACGLSLAACRLIKGRCYRLPGVILQLLQSTNTRSFNQAIYNVMIIIFFVYLTYCRMLVACGLWLVACGLWLVACGLWLVACGLLLVACGFYIHEKKFKPFNDLNLLSVIVVVHCQ
jgi:hypothetical protein